MTPQEFQEVWKLLGTLGIGGVVGAVAMFFVGKWFGAYASKKGENLATKEDIAAITDEIKRVEHGYNVLLEESRANNSLRMAALDRRLQAHQEVFAMWQKICRKVYDGVDPVEMQQYFDWWGSNCLYLEPEVRSGFWDVLSKAMQLRFKHLEGQRLLDAAEIIDSFGNKVFDAMNLPRISMKEAEVLKRELPKGP